MTDDPRRRAILGAALQVFARFGYRRASMDEVARAAKLSRQGLYLHFPNKETLFRESVTFVLDESLGAGKRALATDGSLEDRLVDAFDAIHGAFVVNAGVLGTFSGSTHLAELIEVAKELDGEVVREREAAFQSAVARALSQEGVPEATGLKSADLVMTLEAVATGLKHSVSSREELRTRMRLAVRAVCRTGKKK